MLNSALTERSTGAKGQVGPNGDVSTCRACPGVSARVLSIRSGSMSPTSGMRWPDWCHCDCG